MAVLDNGFVGFDKDAGFLPSNTERIRIYPEEFSRRNNFPPGTRQSVGDHGLRIAQIIWSLMNKPQQGVKFYLLQTNGFSQFQKGVQWAIEQEVDIICYAQIWDTAGNFDGRGFLNRMVKGATDRGIIWVNAAGNFGGKVYNGNIMSSGGFLHFSNHKDRLELESFRDRNGVVIKLVWNEFGETRESPLSKDFDLFLLDQAGNTVASGEKIQVRQIGERREENSSYPFEYVSVNLERGRYYLKVKHIGGRIRSSDRIRVIVNAQNYNEIDFSDATVGKEVMIPADASHVLTAGISGVLGSVGPTMDGRLKPEFIVTNSFVSFTDGQQHDTTSSATGILSGVIALMKGICPRLDRQGIISLIQEPRRSGVDQPRLNQIPRFESLKNECLRRYGTLNRKPRTGGGNDGGGNDGGGNDGGGNDGGGNDGGGNDGGGNDGGGNDGGGND
ncbi:MAG: S8 family serine peptidase, partial [Oligoflexales bacterium]